MTILARIVRFLVWLFLISWSVWLLRRAFGWVLRKAVTLPQQGNDASAPAQTGISRRLVRDPVCGMHVDETLSIPLREGGKLLRFCSIACRDAYTGDTKKFAAHG